MRRQQSTLVGDQRKVPSGAKIISYRGEEQKVSAVCVESSGDNLLLGTEGGNIYTMDLNTFTINDDVIYQDVVMQK